MKNRFPKICFPQISKLKFAFVNFNLHRYGPARCGTYQSVDPGAVPEVNLPVLKLLNADEVSERAQLMALRSVEA